MTIPFLTNSNMILSKYAVEGLKKMFRKGINYKKAGTIVMGLYSSENHQLNMFEALFGILSLKLQFQFDKSFVAFQFELVPP